MKWDVADVVNFLKGQNFFFQKGEHSWKEEFEQVEASLIFKLLESFLYQASVLEGIERLEILTFLQETALAEIV
jgi:hypothetical protein